MSKFQLTYTFDTMDALVAHVTNQLMARNTAPIGIDNPEVGIEPKAREGLLAVLAATPAVLGAVAPSAAPLPPAASATSTAVAAPSPTVQEVLPVFGASPAAVPPVPAPPPAPPAAAAPPAPTAPAAPASPAATVDKTGLPWDARIHSSSKATNADGTWRKLRGLDDGAMVARVEAELRALVALNASAAPAPTAPPPSANPVGDLMMRLMPLWAKGLTSAIMDAAAQKHGLANVSQLATAPNLVPAVEADIMAALPA